MVIKAQVLGCTHITLHMYIYSMLYMVIIIDHRYIRVLSKKIKQSYVYLDVVLIRRGAMKDNMMLQL